MIRNFPVPLAWEFMVWRKILIDWRILQLKGDNVSSFFTSCPPRAPVRLFIPDQAGIVPKLWLHTLPTTRSFASCSEQCLASTHLRHRPFVVKLLPRERWVWALEIRFYNSYLGLYSKVCSGTTATSVSYSDTPCLSEVGDSRKVYRTIALLFSVSS